LMVDDMVNKKTGHCTDVRMDSISFKKLLIVDAPASEVFEFWSEFRNFPKFIWLIESVEILDKRRSRWIVKAPLGKKVTFDSEITEFIKNNSIVWESHHYAVDSWGDIKFTEYHNGTRVDIMFGYAIKHSWVHRLAKIMNRLGFPSMTFDEGLSKIKDEIESKNCQVHRSSVAVHTE